MRDDALLNQTPIDMNPPQARKTICSTHEVFVGTQELFALFDISVR